eukprot:3084847-Prymnesium_polylepis.1
MAPSPQRAPQTAHQPPTRVKNAPSPHRHAYPPRTRPVAAPGAPRRRWRWRPSGRRPSSCALRRPRRSGWPQGARNTGEERPKVIGVLARRFLGLVCLKGGQ